MGSNQSLVFGNGVVIEAKQGVNPVAEDDIVKTLTSRSILGSGSAAMLYTGLDLHRSFSYITTMNDKDKIISF